METIGKDLISYIGLKLDLESIEKLCKTSKKFQEICSSEMFWRNKLIKEFPMIDIDKVKDLKDLYKYLLSKPKIVQPGDLIEKGDIIIVDRKVIFPNDEKILFPEFPPHYYRELKDYLIDTHYKWILETLPSIPYQKIENVDEDYIEGKFGERYNKKIIYTEDDEDPYGVFENYELIVYI